MPKKLKFAQKGYETYSGPIGKFTFVDGVSTEAIHRVDRDQLSTAFQFVEIDADGNENEAGVAARLVKDSAQRAATAPFAGPLRRQTDAERLVEETRTKAITTPASDVLHTRAQLEQIADKQGLKGLRTAAGDKWGVRGRSISDLIDQILGAQARALEARQVRITPEGETPAAPVVEPPTVVVETGSNDAALLAAATGDLGAALNQVNANAETDVESPVVAPAADAAAGTNPVTQSEPGSDVAPIEGSESHAAIESAKPEEPAGVVDLQKPQQDQ